MNISDVKKGVYGIACPIYKGKFQINKDELMMIDKIENDDGKKEFCSLFGKDILEQLKSFTKNDKDLELEL
jgi:hypothetical protein